MFLFTRLSARRTEVLLTILIFSISSGVVSGLFVYIDSAAPNVLDDLTTGVPLDMEVSFGPSFYAQSNTSIEDVRASIAARDYVLAAEDVAVAQIFDYAEEDWQDQRKAFLGIDPDALGRYEDAIEITSSEFDFDDNSCLVEDRIFDRQNLQIGGTYEIHLEFYDSLWNPVTVNLTFTVVGTFESGVYFYQPYYSAAEFTYLHLITTKDTVRSAFGMLEPDYYNGFFDKIWVDFDKGQIAAADAATISEDLRAIKSAIEQEHLPMVYVRSDEFGLLQAVYEYSAWFNSMRTITLAFSIPSIIMGFMLIYYNGRLVDDARRRDVGTLKTRGASGWQAFFWILSSALIVAVIGSLGAIMTGVLGALLSGSVKELLVFDPQQLVGFSIVLQPLSIVSVFIYSFATGAVVAVPGAVRALVMSATEAHSLLSRETLADSEKMGSASVDVGVTLVTAYLLLIALTVMMSPLGSGTAVLMLFLLPVMTMFLFFFARLFARHTSRLKAGVLRRIKRPSMIVGARLASRTVMMFKKSEAMGTMFIAMVFTAGLFASISSTTGSVHLRQLYMFEVGGDISVEFNTALENVTQSLVTNMSSIEGVDSGTPILRYSGYAIYRQAYPWGGHADVNRSLWVYGVDPETWLSAAFWLDYFTLESSPEHSVPLLLEDEGGLINVLSSFRPVDRYILDSTGLTMYPEYGSSIDLQIFSPGGWTNVTDCEIVDVLASKKDDSYSALRYLTGEPDARDFIVTNIDHLHNCLNTSRITKAIFKTVPGANYTQVMQDIYDMAPHSIISIKSSQESLDRTLGSRTTQTIYGAYTLNLLFSLVYLSFGMVIVASLRVRNLRRQLSILRALGSEHGTILKGFLLESAVGVLLAAGVGGLIGGVLSLLVLNLPLLYTGTQTFDMWYRLPVFLQIPVLLITAVVALTVIISQGSTYTIMKRTLDLNIAEEIQYTE